MRLAAAGGGDVEGFAGGGVVDEGVGGVDGAALGGGGGGVAELDVVGDVVVREADAGRRSCVWVDGEVAVAVSLVDGPGVAVLDEPGARRGW